MSANPNEILLPLIIKLEAGEHLDRYQVLALCEAARTLITANLLIPLLKAELESKNT